MSSFLSKRLQDQKRKDAEDQAAQDARMSGHVVDEEEVESAALPPKEEAPAPKKVVKKAAQPESSGIAPTSGKRPGAGVDPESYPNQRVSILPTGVYDSGDVLDTGYAVPQKLRTTTNVKKLRKQLRSKLLAYPDEADKWKRGDSEKEHMLAERLNTILDKMNVNLSKPEYVELLDGLLNDVMGFGAIEPLIQDKGYSEIMVNGPEVVFAEYKGKLMETEIAFDDEEHVFWTAQRIVRPLGRELNRSNPMVDARLPDGSRVHIITLPSALRGTTVTIRKFPDKRLTVNDLVSFKSFTKESALFFEASVVSRMNVVVSGGTGSGKTTLLNVLSSFIPEDERIITVEDSAELNLAQRHVVSLETCPPDKDTGQGRLEIRDLVKGTLRMRPDRLVIGECRSGEALDMLQAMNTGHDGSLTTVHSNSPRDAVARLETLCMMAGMDLPIEVIRAQIASAIHLIVQQSRLKDGSRKVVQVTEVQGLEGDSVVLQDIFIYRTPGQKEPGYSHEGGGILEPTGFRPKFVDQFKQYGFNLPGRVFGVGQSNFG